MDLSEKRETTEEGNVGDIVIDEGHAVKGEGHTDSGWAWIALFASVLTAVFVGGCFSAMGIIQIYLKDAFHADNTEIAWVGSLCIGLINGMGPVASWMINRWSSRVCMFVGGVLGAGSLAVSSQVNSLGMMFVTMGLLAGIGVGLSHTPIYSIIGYYFDSYRTFASGVFLFGTPLGIMSAPTFMTILEAHYGWRGAILIFSGVLLNICVSAALCRPSSREIQIKKKSSSRMRNYLRVCPKPSCSTRCGHGLITNYAFVFLVFALGFSNASISIIYIHLPKYCQAEGATMMDIQKIYLAMGCANMASKMLTGLGSGRVRSGESLDISCLLLGAYSMAAVSLFILPSVAHAQAGRLACFFFVSFYYNTEPPLYVQMTVNLVGLEKLDVALGLELLGIGIGFIAGPPFAAMVTELTDEYKSSFYLAGFYYVLSCMFCLGMMGRQKINSTIDGHQDTLTSS